MSSVARDVDIGTITDRTVFERDIAEACRPVVIRGACAEWPVVKAARRSWAELSEYLLGFDVGLSAQAFVGDRTIAGRYHYGEDLEGFNFQRETMDLGQVLGRIGDAAQGAEAPTIYMGSLPLDQHLPGFSAENGLSILDPKIVPRIWLGNASRVACHFDTYDNLACVVAGHRRFTLYPPEAIGDLYVGPIDHTLAGQPISLAAGSATGDARYPRFDKVRGQALIVDLAPGDALYLPKLWWHQVEALDPANILVNYWWDGFSAGPDAPYTTMMLAMIAIAERPAAERAAWRAYFDHYVFRPQGHPLAHLPPEKHGILGALRSGNYGRIRAMVMQILRGG
jgi:hypothetical protein